jgi:hypothetical protein
VSSTGLTSGRCPGCVKDYILPLDYRGPDAVSNMQWLTIRDVTAKKDKLEKAVALGRRGLPALCPRHDEIDFATAAPGTHQRSRQSRIKLSAPLRSASWAGSGFTWCPQ